MDCGGQRGLNAEAALQLVVEVDPAAVSLILAVLREYCADSTVMLLVLMHIIKYQFFPN